MCVCVCMRVCVRACVRVHKQERLQLCKFSCVSSTCGSEVEVKVDFIVRSGRKYYNLVV